MTMSSEKCPSCGAALPDAARFCVECGVAIGAAASVSAVHTVSGLETAPLQNLPGQQEAADTAMLKPGDVVAGKFEIERVIGQGGMGVVYKAKELVSGQSAALKIIGQNSTGSERAVQRLIDEGTTTRGISHPNVVQIYDIGLYGSQPYIAMEYIDGKPLHIWRGEKMANGEPVPIQVAGQIVKEILNGLEAAHDVGVIHRDLKPENIMLLDEPTTTLARIKIVDFGIALATKTATGSGTGTGLGTQMYMAPEQIRNADAANASADLYSLSKIFYELIIGVLPMGHWQPPSSGRADVLPQVDALIEKGLSVNRDSRPQSAAEYKAALIAAMNGVVPKEQVKSGSNKTALMVGGAVVAMIATVAVFSGGSTGPADDPNWGEDVREHIAIDDDIIDESDLSPPSPSFAYYNGVWVDQSGGAFRVTVSGNGEFSGTGAFGDGTNVTIAGRMDNRNLVFSFGLNGQVFVAGEGERTDQCHFSFEAENFITGRYASGVFHVNHQPGEPCP